MANLTPEQRKYRNYRTRMHGLKRRVRRGEAIGSVALTRLWEYENKAEAYFRDHRHEAYDRVTSTERPADALSAEEAAKLSMPDWGEGEPDEGNEVTGPAPVEPRSQKLTEPVESFPAVEPSPEPAPPSTTPPTAVPDGFGKGSPVPMSEHFKQVAREMRAEGPQTARGEAQEEPKVELPRPAAAAPAAPAAAPRKQGKPLSKGQQTPLDLLADVSPEETVGMALAALDAADGPEPGTIWKAFLRPMWATAATSWLREQQAKGRNLRGGRDAVLLAAPIAPLYRGVTRKLAARKKAEPASEKVSKPERADANGSKGPPAPAAAASAPGRDVIL